MAAYDGLALDLNTSTIVNMKYTKDSTENASEEKHVREISSIWDGTAAADDVEIEFKQLTMSYVYTYGYSAESSAQKRFSGSFIIDGVEMKISDIALIDCPSSLILPWNNSIPMLKLT